MISIGNKFSMHNNFPNAPKINICGEVEFRLFALHSRLSTIFISKTVKNTYREVI